MFNKLQEITDKLSFVEYNCQMKNTEERVHLVTDKVHFRQRHTCNIYFKIDEM